MRHNLYSLGCDTSSYGDTPGELPVRIESASSAEHTHTHTHSLLASSSGRVSKMGVTHAHTHAHTHTHTYTHTHTERGTQHLSEHAQHQWSLSFVFVTLPSLEKHHQLHAHN